MKISIDSLYETSFFLTYKLGIQPSEVNELTIPESSYYMNRYREIKLKELEELSSKGSTSSSNNSSKVKSFTRHKK